MNMLAGLSPHDFGLVNIGYTLAAISIKLIFVDSVIAALLRKQTLTSLDYTTVFWLRSRWWRPCCLCC